MDNEDIKAIEGRHNKKRKDTKKTRVAIPMDTEEAGGSKTTNGTEEAGGSKTTNDTEEACASKITNDTREAGVRKNTKDAKEAEVVKHPKYTKEASGSKTTKGTEEAGGSKTAKDTEEASGSKTTKGTEEAGGSKTAKETKKAGCSKTTKDTRKALDINIYKDTKRKKLEEKLDELSLHYAKPSESKHEWFFLLIKRHCTDSVETVDIKPTVESKDTKNTKDTKEAGGIKNTKNTKQDKEIKGSKDNYKYYAATVPRSEMRSMQKNIIKIYPYMVIILSLKYSRSSSPINLYDKIKEKISRHPRYNIDDNGNYFNIDFEEKLMIEEIVHLAHNLGFPDLD